MWEVWRSRRSFFNGLGKKKDGMASPPNAETPTTLARLASVSVQFRDATLTDDAAEYPDAEVHDEEEDTEDSTNKDFILKRPRKQAERTKYIIILVGLPGRGKTFLCNKLKCYLNWLGHHTRHFNVGSYRRCQKQKHEVQTADFFDSHNQAGMEARARALQAALDDMLSYLYSAEGQVAIFDATNTTRERRQHLRDVFHGKFQYLFIESICNDDKVLDQNYRFKMQYSPDYAGMNTEKALADFKERIRKYEEVYEEIKEREIHYIKLIDMVTGRGHMDVNRISGYLPGKIVFFLMQVCKAGMAQARKIWLTRHGESEFNVLGRIGGDSGLAPSGDQYARCLPDMLVDRLPLSFDEQQSIPVSVWTSTLKRTIQTARYLPFPKLRWKALDEIHAGVCDGLTYKEIEQKYPEEFAARGKDKLRYRYPAGESYMDVIQRLEPVIIEMEREKECICIVAHQAVLRAIYGYFKAEPLQSVPTLEVPLHAVVELQPRADGTMGMDVLSMEEFVKAQQEATMAGYVTDVGGEASSSAPGEHPAAAPRPMRLSAAGAPFLHHYMTPSTGDGSPGAVSVSFGSSPATALGYANGQQAGVNVTPPRHIKIPFGATAGGSGSEGGAETSPLRAFSFQQQQDILGAAAERLKLQDHGPVQGLGAEPEAGQHKHAAPRHGASAGAGDQGLVLPSFGSELEHLPSA